MKNYLGFFALFLLLPFGLLAQEIRATSFDERPACEESKGVWRQFGNGCVDECRAKFDIFSICSQSLSFGCDCGKNHCWNGETCVLMADYKKIFDEERAAEKEILNEAKKNRQEAAKENQELIMNNLLTKLTPLGPDGKPLPVAPQPLVPEQQATPPSSAVPLPAATQPIATAPDNSLIPPFYSQQEQAKQAAASQQSQAATASTTTAPAADTPSTSTLTLPGLPVIPLP